MRSINSRFTYLLTYLVPTRTEMKILQHNRLDTNGFHFGKTVKNCTDIFEGSIKILGTEVFFLDGGQPEAEDFLRLTGRGTTERERERERETALSRYIAMATG